VQCVTVCHMSISHRHYVIVTSCHIILDRTGQVSGPMDYMDIIQIGTY